MRGSFRFSETPARTEWSRRASFGLIGGSAGKTGNIFLLFERVSVPPSTSNRVRKRTAERVNSKARREILMEIPRRAAEGIQSLGASPNWIVNGDIERTLEANAAMLILLDLRTESERRESDKRSKRCAANSTRSTTPRPSAPSRDDCRAQFVKGPRNENYIAIVQAWVFGQFQSFREKLSDPSEAGSINNRD